MDETRMRDPAVPPADRTSNRPPGQERGAFQFTGKDDDSISGLVHRLAGQGSHLAEQQLRLVEAEIRSGVDDIKQSAGAMAGALVLGLAGTGVLMMGVAYLLAEAMPLWLATLLVGAIALAGAAAMAAAGRKKLQSTSLSVDRTRRTLQRAPSAMSGQEEEGRTSGR